jgi:hypothetical protein
MANIKTLADLNYLTNKKNESNILEKHKKLIDAFADEIEKKVEKNDRSTSRLIEILQQSFKIIPPDILNQCSTLVLNRACAYSRNKYTINKSKMITDEKRAKLLFQCYCYEVFEADDWGIIIFNDFMSVMEHFGIVQSKIAENLL